VNIYALRAPAQDYKMPAWATMHNIVTAAVVAAGLLVIILLVRAVGRLAKAVGTAAAPAPAPKRSGGGGKLLLAAAGVIGGLLAWGHFKPAASGVKAAPAPSPAPVPAPRPTVTQTVAPHVTHVTLPAHFPLTGTQILIGLAVIVIGGWLITRIVVRNLP
jgi:hypothetical protein